jgi:hypothetical protein
MKPVHVLVIVFLFLILAVPTCFPQPGSNGSNGSSGGNNSVLPANPSDTAIQIDYLNKTLKIPCVVNLTDGVVEWVLSFNGFRGYESFLQTFVNPNDLNLGLIGLGYKKICAYRIPDQDLAKKIKAKKSAFRQLKLLLSWSDSAGVHTLPLESFFKEVQSDKKPENISWYFNSLPFDVDRVKARQIPLVSKTHRNINYSVIEMNSLYLFDYYVLVMDKEVVPPKGTKATLIINKFDN